MPDYQLLARQIAALTEDQHIPLPILSNTAALLWNSLSEINWCGFYLKKGETLVLGPFVGQVACMTIPFGKGVCGTAAATKQTQRVDNVHTFSGHIACDSASNSEIVIPMIQDGELLGVLDIDSPSFNRFTEEDEIGLCAVVSTLMEGVDWTNGII